MRTICDRTSGVCHEAPEEQAIPAEVMTQVKHVVEQYLPGMEGAQVSFSNEIGKCSEGCSNCLSSQLGDKQKNVNKSGRKVITLSKDVSSSSVNLIGKTDNNKLIHRHYARLTLDKYGKLIKLTVSR
jgi:hypothetical protein